MSSVISQILSAPPPGEIVAVFSDKHVAFAYMAGGKWYGTDQRPLRWKPKRWQRGQRISGEER